MMRKDSSKRVVCSVAGCCSKDGVDGDPPLCRDHARERDVLEKADLALSAASVAMSNGMWADDPVDN